jgi:hypothetical protein
VIINRAQDNDVTRPRLQAVLGSVLPTVSLRVRSAYSFRTRRFPEQSVEYCGVHYVSGLVYKFPFCIYLRDGEQQQVETSC